MGPRLWSIITSLTVVAALVQSCGAVINSGAPPQLTPPMGWNSWNSGIALTEQSVKAVIDAMVKSGMRDAGYRYVNLDAGWAARSRGPHRELKADPARFPDGIAALARYAHARGLRLGLYSSPYNQTCGQGPGGLRGASCYAVRDLWTHRGSTTAGPITGPGVAPHGVTMLRISAGC